MEVNIVLALDNIFAHLSHDKIHHGTSTRRTVSHIVDKASTEAFNECTELYDKNECERCIGKVQEILEDAAAPAYHRMKSWILLEICLGDWDNDCYLKAESTWRIMRRWNRAGEDASNDAMLAELHGKLEELKKTLV
jgi:hypothetical protein